MDNELKLIKKENVKVITIKDADYPVNLKEIHDPPAVLYVKGELKKEDKLSVAIVGSRRSSNYGRDTAERLARELAQLGITVVSGMARGIDTSAHNGALNSKGRTIAVLGSGLANIYPPENKALVYKIAESGAVISEFPMTMPPLAGNFPRRNRIISGLSLGTVVVEAAQKSGALITARCAYEQNREVFSVPGEAGRDTASGTNQLIKDGAKLVETATDILEELAVPIKDCLIKRSKVLPADLKQEELKILQVLESGPMYVDKIAEESLISISGASSALTVLEIKGLIKRLPGNVFTRS
jgi:DNA processing protein